MYPPGRYLQDEGPLKGHVPILWCRLHLQEFHIKGNSFCAKHDLTISTQEAFTIRTSCLISVDSKLKLCALRNAKNGAIFR